MRVLIIPENPTTDQYILKPIVTAMLERLGRYRAKVEVLQDPHMCGISDALDRSTIEEIIDRYKGMVDVFLLIVDRDNNEGRRASLTAMELFAAESIANKVFLGENAWQEVEVWLLAGHALPTDWKWSEIRAETHPKENYFEPFAASRNLQNSVGGGRLRLGLEAAANYQSIRGKCREDVQNLETRLASALGSDRAGP